jgi:isoleucyl-tRNA synthetase
VPGWDCHGLPIEWKIEEKYREGQEQGRCRLDPMVQFRDECRKFAAHWVKVQSKTFSASARSATGINPYLTMTYHAEASIAARDPQVRDPMAAVSRCQAGHVVGGGENRAGRSRGRIQGTQIVTVWVKFPVVKASKHGELEDAFRHLDDDSLDAARQPRHRYGADMDYALYEVKAIAEGSKAKAGRKTRSGSKKLSEQVQKDAKISRAHKNSRHTRASRFCRHHHRPPAGVSGKGYDFDVPVLAGDFVTTDTGTGFVHIAPSHGEDDFNLGLANGLEMTDNRLMTTACTFRGRCSVCSQACGGLRRRRANWARPTLP